MLKEFKEFAMKGNVVDLAVGVIIGAAFGKIVDSMVKDVLMPPIGMLLGGVDFSSLFVVLTGGTFASLKAAQDAGAPTVNYGVFLNTVVQFLIVAFCVFLVIKAVNRMKRNEAPAPAPAAPSTKACPECLSNIPLAARRCAHCTSPLAA